MKKAEEDGDNLEGDYREQQRVRAAAESDSESDSQRRYDTWRIILGAVSNCE